MMYARGRIGAAWAEGLCGVVATLCPSILIMPKTMLSQELKRYRT